MSSNQQPIFICGTSRSGSTLLEKLLTKNTELYIVPETHYFDDLRVKLADKINQPLTKEEQKQCEDYFLALTHRPYGHQGDAEKGTLSREELQNSVRKLNEEGVDAYFKAYCHSRLKPTMKTLWGEKTPRHVFRINDILSVFPEAKIIFMLRDPRAVVSSYRDWRNQDDIDFSKDPDHEHKLAEEEERVRISYHPIIISLLWLSAIKTALAAVTKYGSENIYIQKYEDLCTSPERELNKLYQWLKLTPINIENEIPIVNSSYLKPNEKGGMSTIPIERWRNKLSPEEIYIIQFFCQSLFVKLNYELVHQKKSLLKLIPYLISFIPTITMAIYKNANRTGNVFKYIWRRLSVCFLK